MAGLTAHEAVVDAVCRRERGVAAVLGLCRDASQDLRHRGVVIVYNMVATAGKAGELARAKIRAEEGLKVLQGLAQGPRSDVVTEVAQEALKVLLSEV